MAADVPPTTRQQFLRRLVWDHARLPGPPDHCVVPVHLGYAADGFPGRRDGAFDRPKGGDDDRDRGHAASIPEEMTSRPKGRIALELLDLARAHGVAFSWLTFDEGHGGKPPRGRGINTQLAT